MDAVYFNSNEGLLFSNGGNKQTGVSAVLEHQIKALQADICVCQSQLTFKGPVYNYKSHFFESTKKSRLLGGRL